VFAASVRANVRKCDEYACVGFVFVSALRMKWTEQTSENTFANIDALDPNKLSLFQTTHCIAGYKLRITLDLSDLVFVKRYKKEQRKTQPMNERETKPMR